ncbi:nicotinate (nicotinamide) nucleotide adenylyltransferase [Shewanella sp. SNU WT4]|uniref:nicotinate (nicotinamide) nucleotide adenylyltransferase n=1 Tax=Shewanella sp. SNU WT4 TaxID=2590015 RepID=UPI001126CD3D|nr:nicotinate (nicotinamide) nucleotide adenylyltransferase [Shewanella sp. SNU WT4]QDF67935.1 nicotinate (nicotinamide) nucleotide adenylyltransferase [Shewanella sp. SNU WT4]
MRIALLGGTFDPIHLGHIQLALAAKSQLAVDEVWLLPNATPPHKPQPKANVQQRLAMLSLVCKQWPELNVCDYELKQAGPNYTYLTLQGLHKLYPQHQWVFLMGMDSLVNLPLWRSWQELLTLCHIGVYQRPGWQLEAQTPVAAYYQTHLVTQDKIWQRASGAFTPCIMPDMPISSSDIRAQLQANTPYDLVTGLPHCVQDYIAAEHLYR